MPFSPGARRLSQLQIDTDKDFGGKAITGLDRLGFSDLTLRQNPANPDELQIWNPQVAALRHLQVGWVLFSGALMGTGAHTYLRTPSSATSEVELGAHDGAAVLATARLINGMMELLRPNLTGELQAGGSPGTSGQFLQSQGPGAAPGWGNALSPTQPMLPVAFAGWATAVSGGTVYQRGGFLLLSVPGVAGYWARLEGVVDFALPGFFDKNPEYQMRVYMNNAAGGLRDFAFIIGHNGHYATTAKYFGWYYDGNLKVVSCDGVTRSTTTLGALLTGDQWGWIRQRLEAGVLKTWVDGAAQANHTANLPSGGLSGYLLSFYAYTGYSQARYLGCLPFIIFFDM